MFSTNSGITVVKCLYPNNYALSQHGPLDRSSN